MSMIELTAFFGWMSVINIGLLSLSALMIIVLKDKVKAIHAKLFGIECDNLECIYFKFLANYKLMVIVFNIAPYFALRLMV